MNARRKALLSLTPLLLAAGIAHAASGRTLIGAPAEAPLSASENPRVVETLERLSATARQEGAVKVILGLRTPFEAEAFLSRAEVQSQRSDIAAAQSSVLSRLPAGRRAQAKRFQTVPFMAVEVTATELDQLAGLYEVTSIEEDALAAPTLADSIPLIDADVAWTSGYTGAGQTVAILDTGVDKTHAFLTGKVLSEACYSTTYSGYSSTSVCPGGASESTVAGSGLNCSTTVDGCDHGTHVAGIAAGQGAGFSGVARDAGVIAVQVFSRFDSTTYCGSSSPCALSYTSDQVRGLERVYALRSTYNIAAVNMSLGGDRYYDQSSCDSGNVAIKTAIDNLRAAGIATVVAAGNESYTDSLSAPGCISTAISVGSTTKADAVSSFSNSAYFLNLLAPGGSIYSSVPGGGYATMSGTSMAAPHVAGAWALLKQKTPALAVGDGLNTLIATGQPVTDTRSDINRTTPRINLAAALVDDWQGLMAPSAGSATNILATGFTANWTSATGATGYRLDVATSSSFSTFLSGYQNLDVGTATSYTVSGLAAGSTYYYRVRAYNGTDTSANSNIVSATTTAAALNSGQLVSNLSGSASTSKHYYLDVPSGATNLTIQISGGTGDADLYLRRGNAPTMSTYDCRPYITGNSESCTISSPAAGRYYIMVYGYQDYAGVSLSVQYQAGSTPRPETPGLYDPATGKFYLRNSNSAGVANTAFVYGPPGNAGWIPLTGDWNGDGQVTVGLYNPAQGKFYLRNSNSVGMADVTFVYGPANAGWIPLTGDWDGNGTTTVGLYNPANATFYLRNSNTQGSAEITFVYGPANAGWIPLTGDWDGNGTTTIGLYNPAQAKFHLRNTNTRGTADVGFVYGPANADWIPLTGDWDGNGRSTAGLYNPATGTFYLRNSTTQGVADVTFRYGPSSSTWAPLIGTWTMP